MRKYDMKVNPEKCTFGATSGNFLRYLVTKRGIEVDPAKIQAIVEMPSPRNLKEVHKLNGSVAALGRFIARSSDKCKHFFNILKKGTKFPWTAECEEAFKKIKEYLATISILHKPDPNEVLALYIAATEDAVSAVLVKNNTKVEQLIYYVSKTLNASERNYTKIEQIILALLWATQKLRTYFLTHYVRIPCKAPLEVVLKNAGKVGRITKWNTQLEQFNIIHDIQTAQKSKVLADFLADLPLDNDKEVKDIPRVEEDGKDLKDVLDPSNQRRWEVFVDGSRNKEGAGIGIVITTPTGDRIVHALRLEFERYTNNIVKYEALVHALRLIMEMGMTDVRLTSDSQLVIRQIELEYNTYDETLSAYMALVQTLASQIPNIKFRHLCRKDLRHADALSYISSMLKDKNVKSIKIARVHEPSVIPQQTVSTTNREDDVEEDIAEDDVGENIADDFTEDDIFSRANEDEDFSNEEDWRTEVHLYLKTGTLPSDVKQARKVQSKAGRYELREKGHRILKDIHYGDAGNHSGMRSLADKDKMQGYYWPHMIRDAARMATRFEECQRFSKKIHAPATNLNSVGSPWPFAKWGIDIVGPFITGTGKR
ncbi:uncharacterized protein LOC113272448 [Papaver somniferum]|uniref:uncharacterized protein LOC113272448 n=1 Tax=Papaver somniferum TaxID=3469 RepID=UPI000E704A6D|nr:uncharacterized protein LOC113272448 [Papaver somniferum]